MALADMGSDPYFYRRGNVVRSNVLYSFQFVGLLAADPRVYWINDDSEEFLFPKRYNNTSIPRKQRANDYLKVIAVMGGFKRSNNSQNFKGGELTAIMGGLEIDLREASMKGEAIIDIFAMMGGMEMRVPEDWLIIIEGFPFMGRFEDKTHHAQRDREAAYY